jgi:cell surface protein SprA
MTFTNDYSRIYNERQVRNIIVPTYEFDPIYLKRFDWNRNYQIGYDLTKNLKTTFSATNKSIFVEGNNGVDRVTNPEGYREFMDTIRSQITTFGRTMDYTHNYSVSYNVPLDKFPLTSWITANAKYAGTFNWQRAPLGQAPFGNTVQNNRTVNMTLQGNLVTLYNKVPYFKRVLSDGKGMKSNVNAKVGNAGEGGAAGKPKPGPTKLPEFKPEKPLEEMTAKELKQYERQKKRFDKKQLRLQEIKDKEKEKVNPIKEKLVEKEKPVKKRM